MAKSSPKVLVIGAGVVGLSTAVCIQDRIPQAEVTIFADKTGDDTLSSGAGGIFRPSFSIDSNKEKVLKWCESSLKHFINISSSSDASAAGLQLVSGYYLSSSEKPYDNALLKELLPVYRIMSEKELGTFPDKYMSGIFFSTVVTDCRYYLPWLSQKFKSSGGNIELRHVNNLSEISNEFDVIVNCTGLGAKHLMNDHLLMPIRGQTIKVKAPWVKQFYYGDDVYILPGVDYVTLGGVKDYESWNLSINPYQKQFIWDECLKIVPSLQNAEVMWDWVGLRPYRPSVCLEATVIQNEGKLLKVVNNYGHGANGVSLSWGTALEAANLTEKLLTETFFIAKL